MQDLHQCPTSLLHFLLLFQSALSQQSCMIWTRTQKTEGLEGGLMSSCLGTGEMAQQHKASSNCPKPFTSF